MATTRRVQHPSAPACARKQLFRSTAGLSLEEQRQVANQLQSSGENVLQKIEQLKKSSKQQKRATKTTSLKFEWLREHSQLKRQEETCSRELESLLLRMFNDTSMDKTPQRSASRECIKKGKGMDLSQECPEEIHEDEDGDNNADENPSGPPLTAILPREKSSVGRYALELEDLIQTEQASRVVLMKQITSLRDQRASMKHLLGAIASRHQAQSSEEPGNNQANADHIISNARDLIFDAVIGLQFVETSLEDEVAQCEKEVQGLRRSIVSGFVDKDISTDKTGVIQADASDSITSVLTNISIKDCPDELLRLEVFEEAHRLAESYQNDMDQYRREFEASASGDEAAGSLEAAQSKTGGWQEADDERFLKVLKSFNERKGTKKMEFMYDEAATLLPHMTMKEIKMHAKFHQHLRFYQEKCRDRRREFKRRVSEFQENALARTQQAAKLQDERNRKIQELEAQKLRCSELKGRVDQWKETQEAKARIEQQQHEIEQLIEQQRQEDESQKRKKKQEQQRLAVEEYRRERTLEQIAEEKRALEEQMELEKQKEAQAIINNERVQFRQAEYQRKLDELRLEEEERKRAEEQRLAKLDALKEQTPYAQIIANIAPDPERTRQETAAFRANVEAAQEALPVHEAGLFPSHGYDCDTLFKNARFKLGIALRNAGLESSEYARQALANVKVCNVGSYRNHVSGPTQLW